MEPDEARLVNALVRQALIAAREVMGENGLNTVLRTAGLESYVGNLPPDDLQPGLRTVDYARLNEIIEAFYGRAGRRMLRRIGKASFRYTVREQGSLMGLGSTTIKLLPQRQRMLFVLNHMASVLKKTNPQVDAWVEDKGGKIAFCERTCAICHQRKSDHPICYLYLGSIGEAIRWATGGDFDVRETHCRAKGDATCRFEIGESIN